MGGLMVLRLRKVEEGEVVGGRVAICDRVVRCRWAVVVCHVAFVLSRRCPWMVAHHRGREAMRDQVIPGGIPWYWWVFCGLFEV